MTDDADAKAQQAHRKARRAQRWSWFWWALVPVICVTYWVVSDEKYPERIMFSILAAVSFIANAVTYAGKAEAAEATAAGYENP